MPVSLEDILQSPRIGLLNGHHGSVSAIWWYWNGSSELLFRNPIRLYLADFRAKHVINTTRNKPWQVFNFCRNEVFIFPWLSIVLGEGCLARNRLCVRCLVNVDCPSCVSSRYHSKECVYVTATLVYESLNSHVQYEALRKIDNLG